MGKAGLSAVPGRLAAALAATVLAASAGLLVACTSARPGPAALPRVSIATTPLPIAPPYVQLSNDTCGANALGWLVGRPRTEIPIPADLSHRRVTCTACPMDGGGRPDRLNILYDARTGRVASLSCR